MKIIIQAGGKGTRLEHLTYNRPKCLVPVHNKPMIFHLFNKYSQSEFVVIGDYKYDVLEKYLETFAKDVNYKIVRATGTGNICGIKQALEYVNDNEQFMLIWSDLVLSEDFRPEELPHGNYVGILEGQTLVASPVDKKKIKKFFSTKLYKNITTQNSNIMYKIIDNKIISLSKKIENNLLNTIETEIQNKLNRSDNHESSRDGLINILGCLIDFMLNHKIKNIEKVRELISQLEKIKYKNEYNIQEFDELLRLLKMTSNPQNFDLSTAKLTDFAYLDDKYIKNLNINNSNLKGFVKLLLDNINMEKYDKYTTKSIKNKLYSMINIQEEEE